MMTPARIPGARCQRGDRGVRRAQGLHRLGVRGQRAIRVGCRHRLHCQVGLAILNDIQSGASSCENASERLYKFCFNPHFIGPCATK